jgi:hypothetical protein
MEIAQKMLDDVKEAPFSNPILNFFKSLTISIEKLNKMDYYELELDVYTLVKASCQLVYNETYQRVEDYYQAIQSLIQEPQLKVPSTDDSLIRFILQNPKAIRCLEVAFWITKESLGLGTFAKLIIPIKAFRIFRSTICKQRYKRLWNGRVDTTYIYDLLKDPKFTSNLELCIRYFAEVYGETLTDSCFLRNLIKSYKEG